MLFEKQTISEGLYLAAATPVYSLALFALIQQEREYLEQWMEWPKRLDSQARCNRYVREMELINGVGQQFFSFIIFQQQLAGSIALAKIDDTHQAAELGFWKSKYRLPKAQMQKAMQAFIQACWKNSPLHRLEIQTATTNLPAKILSEKLGFVLEGSKRDALLIDGQFVNLDIYGLLRK